MLKSRFFYGLVGVFVCAILCLSSNTAQALTITTSGNIFNTVDAQGVTGSTVDHWDFTVNTAGNIGIDLLSWETKLGTNVDVNGDGEIAMVDTHIRLFADDGSLDAADFLFANNKSIWTLGDGSISIRDSYLNKNLAIGNYTLAVGAYNLTTAEAIAQTNSPNNYPIGGGVIGGPEGDNTVNYDHGDYQITWTGDVTITGGPGVGQGTPIPEPTTVALLGIGLVGLAGAEVRRRRKKREVDKS
jgi:hypothetical protein